MNEKNENSRPARGDHHNGVPDRMNRMNRTNRTNGDTTPARAIPEGVSIPAGVRVVVRMRAGIDERTGRMSYRDVLGHVESWDGTILRIRRDASIDGSRPECLMDLNVADIAVIKPVPERRTRPRGSAHPSV